MMCTPTERHGFPIWLCELRKFKDCGKLFIHEKETDVSEGAPIIQFSTYLKQSYCLIHGVVPTRSTIYHTCDTNT